MRAEPMRILAAAAAVVAALAGPALAAPPCVDGHALLAQAGPRVLQSRGTRAENLSFHLAAACRVWVEADGLEVDGAAETDAVPDAFLDETCVGPLVPGSGRSWRSPLALRLGPGIHTLLVRCPRGWPVRLRWTRLEVLGDGPCRPVRAARPRPVARVEGAFAPCGKLIRRTHWPARLHRRRLVLSAAPSGDSRSGTLVRLHPGQSWRALMAIPRGADGAPQALKVSFSPVAKGKARFLVWVDGPQAGRVGALGYTPGAWESLRVALCSGRLLLRFAREPVLSFPCAEPHMDFEVAVRDLRLVLEPVAGSRSAAAR